MIINWRGDAARTQFTAPAKSAETLQRTMAGVLCRPGESFSDD